LHAAAAVRFLKTSNPYNVKMSILGRGIRNAFRNATRTVSIVLILGLAIGLALVMLVAHRAVGEKVSTTLGSVGNTVTIGPPGYSAGGPLGKFLTPAELAPIAHLPGVTSLDEYLNGTAKASDVPQNAPKGPEGKAVCARTSGCQAIKTGSTSLKYPGTLAFATQGLACEPAPCTPLPPSYFTVYFSGSTEPTAAVNIGASTLKIVSGQAISGTSSAYDAMISTAMAQKNGLKVGSTFTAYGRTFTVAAIFESDSQQGSDTIVTPLPVLQRLTGQTGQVFSAVVTAASLTELATVTSEIERVLGPRASVVSYLADADQAVTDLDGVNSIALDSLVGAVAAAVVILFLVMVMIVRERKREIGILKAIGAPNGRIMAQFTTEAVTFTLLGLVVGVLVGIIAASPVTSSLVSHSGVSSETGARGLFGAGNPVLTQLTDLNAQVGWTVTLEGLAAAVVVAVLASAAAAWMISRVRPAEVLRSAS
jgi:putative ABC transport system permease protein